MLKFKDDAVHVHTGFAVMKHRVRRNRIPIERRERIVRAFEDPHEKRRNVNTIIGLITVFDARQTRLK